MIVALLVVATVAIELVCMAAETLAAWGWRTQPVPAGVMASPLEEPAAPAPAERPAAFPLRRPRPPAPRVTLAMARQLHDSLGPTERVALHALPVDWYAQGERVETGLAMEPTSPLYRQAHALLRRLAGPCALVDLPEGASRCWVCGCTDLVGCRGGCAWWRPNWCTRCTQETETEPRVQLAGGMFSRPQRPPRRRNERVRATALPTDHERVVAMVQRLVPGILAPAVARYQDAAVQGGGARPGVGSLCAIAGALEHLAPVVRVAFEGEPSAPGCVVIDRASGPATVLAPLAAAALADALRRLPRAGLVVLWVGPEGRVDLVPLAHVTDRTVAGRRAS